MAEVKVVPRSKVSFLAVASKYRKLVASILLGVVVLFFGLSFVMPQKYSSSTTLLPPEKQGVSGLMSFLSSSSSALDFVKGGGQENPALEMFKNILDSRVISEEIAMDPRVHRYFSSWDTSTKAITGVVRDAMSSEALRNGMMTISVDLPTHWLASKAESDSARVLSAYVTNLYAKALDRYNRERLMTTAHNTRVFIESEYNNRMLQLDTAYAKLQAFQEEHKAISLSDQLSSTVTAAALLGSEAQQLEMQIAVEERELNPNSTRIEMLRAQLEEAKSALKKYDEGGVGDYVIALNNVPALARTLAGYTREVKLLEQISAYLRQQLETEKINEQRDLPSLQVLDAAIPPEKRSSPSHGMSLLLGIVIGSILSALYLVSRTYRDRLRAEPENHRHFLTLMSALRGREVAAAIDTHIAAGPAGAVTIERASRQETERVA